MLHVYFFVHTAGSKEETAILACRKQAATVTRVTPTRELVDEPIAVLRRYCIYRKRAL